VKFFFTEDQEMWHSTIDDFMEKEIGREYVRKCDMERHYPYEAWDKVVKQGWIAPTLPEKYGGMGGDIMIYAIYIDALSKYSYDFGAAAFALPIFTADTIMQHATEEQKERYLPAFCQGKIRFSFSLTEPDAGSDAANVSTAAELKGDHFVINGHKMFSTAAHVKGNIITLVARTDRNAPKRHQGLSLILVPNDTPGVEMRLLPTLARRCTGTNEIFFNDVRVPKENLLGELNKAWYYVLAHLEVERISCATGATSNAQTAVTDAINYAKGRVQFGQPISKFQVIQHMLADMQTEVDAAYLMSYRAAWMKSRGERCLKEANMAKLFATEVFLRAATNAMQIWGGYAQLPESDVERYWREAKQAMVGGGTVQINRLVIARELGL
jgi:alkylation response protein AidB-like acyl-CoA dehydrogenase